MKRIRAFYWTSSVRKDEVNAGSIIIEAEGETEADAEARARKLFEDIATKAQASASPKLLLKIEKLSDTSSSTPRSRRVKDVFLLTGKEVYAPFNPKEGS